MQHYTTYRSYLRRRFGGPVVKIPLSGGFSCPNRDGTLSCAGCTFCDNRSFSPAAQTDCAALEQLRRAVERRRNSDSRFLVYLQPYSNTYAPVDTLRAVYEPLISEPGVVGLAVGTRPDCLPDPICAYLGELSHRTYLSVELGLQSSHDTTLARCNRGHTFGDFRAAVSRLDSLHIETVAHVMLGLPGEDASMMRLTAQRLAELPVTGVKIHQLMVIAGTPVERDYRQGAVAELALEQHAELLCDFLAHLRPDQHIHRIMADSQPCHGLVAPLWSARKTESLAYIHAWMDRWGVVQGAAYRKA